MIRRALVSFLVFAWAAAGQEAPVIILLGPPGAGKTTQAEALKRRLKVPVIGVADLLREQVGKKTPEGKALRAAIESGDLLRAELVNDLIGQRLLAADVNQGFILDGYPRTEPQARFLDRVLLARGFARPRVVVLEVSDAEARKRMAGRGRADDRAGMAERRLAEYRQEEALVKEHYKGQLVLVDGERGEKEVEAAVQKALDY
jgi:adenylate kinase